jgi:hypothetical protein
MIGYDNVIYVNEKDKGRVGIEARKPLNRL